MKVVKAVVAVVDVPRSAKERLKVPWPGTLGRPNLACLSTWKTWKNVGVGSCTSFKFGICLVPKSRAALQQACLLLASSAFNISQHSLHRAAHTTFIPIRYLKVTTHSILTTP